MVIGPVEMMNDQMMLDLLDDEALAFDDDMMMP